MPANAFRRGYGLVRESELAAVNAALRLYLGLEPDPIF
jgi:hypothetical protein